MERFSATPFFQYHNIGLTIFPFESTFTHRRACDIFPECSSIKFRKHIIGTCGGKCWCKKSIIIYLHTRAYTQSFIWSAVHTTWSFLGIENCWEFYAKALVPPTICVHICLNQFDLSLILSKTLLCLWLGSERRSIEYWIPILFYCVLTIFVYLIYSPIFFFFIFPITMYVWSSLKHRLPVELYLYCLFL